MLHLHFRMFHLHLHMLMRLMLDKPLASQIAWTAFVYLQTKFVAASYTTALIAFGRELQIYLSTHLTAKNRQRDQKINMVSWLQDSLL